MGAALFVSTFVAQACMMAQKQEPVGVIKLTPAFFLRDLSVFLFVMAYLLVILVFVGYIDMLFALGFVVTYVVYVMIVVIQSGINRDSAPLDKAIEYVQEM